MAIIRYSPRSEINFLQQQLEQMLDEVLTPNSLTEFGNFSKFPAAELTETEDALVLKLELPGIEAKDLNIEATAKSISVSGERQSEVKENTRSEFRYGSFQRVIPLPLKIQNTEIKAEQKNGILHLTLPLAIEEKNKVVKVSLDKANA